MHEAKQTFFAELTKQPAGWQSAGAMLCVGVAVTVVIFVLLGHFTRPGRVAATQIPNVQESPFAEVTTQTSEEASSPDSCQVMHTAIEDINTRMSEGVNEAQARYFRARRNRLYLLMRERCGV